MDLPVHQPSSLRVRSATDVRAMALAVQANLVQLRTAALRRWPKQPELVALDVPPPGHVAAYRETLFDRAALKVATDMELVLGVRELWGQYSAMRWVFQQAHPDGITDLARLEPDVEMHCEASLEAKAAEIHALSWRVRHEQQLRHDPTYRDDPRFAEYASLAARIPAEIFGTPVSEASDGAIAQTICEFAGILRVVRWVLSPRIMWNDPRLNQVAERPF